jgi:hypothetical protein
VFLGLINCFIVFVDLPNVLGGLVKEGTMGSVLLKNEMTSCFSFSMARMVSARLSIFDVRY